jgi:RNA polymerase sigma-70 factor (ECF subfamily)
LTAQSKHEASPIRAIPPSAVPSRAGDRAVEASDRRGNAREGALDVDSRRWIARLQRGAPDHQQAVEELRALLLRAASFEVRRRAATVGHVPAGELDDLAQQSANDALMAVLAKLGDFRGASRFTTWAYKFALLEAGVAVRRRAWRGRELQLESDTWSAIADRAQLPHEEAETRELIAALQGAIAAELSPRQREVLVAITLNDVPIDVLAERMQTTRGALYKTLHDARGKLRASLAARGLAFDRRVTGSVR